MRLYKSAKCVNAVYYIIQLTISLCDPCEESELLEIADSDKHLNVIPPFEVVDLVSETQLQISDIYTLLYKIN